MAPEQSTRIERVEERLDRLEQWKNEAVTRTALDAQQDVYYTQRFDKVDRELAEIKAAAWRIIWVVAGSFAVSFVAWVINGGLKIG